MNSNMFNLDDRSKPLLDERETDKASVDLSRLLKAISRRRWAIGVSVLIWSILGLFFVLTTPRYYDAQSQVLLDANIGRTLQQVSTTTDLTTTDTAMSSAQLVISSDEVVGRVVDKLNLSQNPAFMNPPVSLTAQLIGKAIMAIRAPLNALRMRLDPTLAQATADGATAVQPTPEQIAKMQRDSIIQLLQMQISINRIGDSSAFAITYRSNDPQLATDIVNTFAQVYVSDVLNANFEATERMTSWMQQRLQTLETDATQAAQAAEAFRAKNGLVAKDNSTMTQNSVSALNTDLTTAIANSARVQARVTALQAVVDRGADAMIKDGVLSGIPPIQDPDFTLRQQELTGLLTNLERTKNLPNVPAAAVRTGEVRVKNAVDRLFASIKLELEKAKGEAALATARVQALRDTLNSAVGNDAKSGSAQVELRALEDRASTLSALYQSFLTKFQEIDQQKSFPVSNVRIIKLAQVPPFAAGPSAKVTLALCIVLGLMTGLFIAAIREWRDRFLYTSEQVTDELGAHFLGYLPEITPISTVRHESQKARLRELAAQTGGARPVPPKTIETFPASHALEKPRSHFAETLRSIRLSSQIVGSDMRSHALGISSARPNEGKTVIAYNLALSIAAGGSSVMLIDADPHRSGMSHLFGLSRIDGLVEVLGGKLGWRDACRHVGKTGVDLLAGVVPSGFSHGQEMLGGDAFGRLITDLRGEYDFIILDLPPMGPVSDVRAVIDNVDNLVLIAEWGKTSKLLLHKLIRSDSRISQKLLGIALNKVDMKRLRAYSTEADSSAYISEYGEYYVQ